MFIESNYESHEVRSSGARCFRQWYGRSYVSLLWSEEVSFRGREFYKHYFPTGRGNWLEKFLQKKRKRPLYYRSVIRLTSPLRRVCFCCSARTEDSCGQIMRLRNYSFEERDQQGNKSDNKPGGPGKDRREPSFAVHIVRIVLKPRCVASLPRFAPQ
jgi:hypothetical protein